VSAGLHSTVRKTPEVFPYRLQHQHVLCYRVCAKQAAFCSSVNEQIEQDENFTRRCIFTNSAMLFVSSAMNMRNVIVWDI
jgi:hypothetical protein